MSVSRGACRGRVLWLPHMPHPMLAMPYHAISCTPIPPWSSSKCRNTPSTNQLHVFAFQVGRSVWLNMNTSSSSKISGRVGTLGIYSILISISSSFFCGYHKILPGIRYSIPSVPSRLEELKTHDDLTRTLTLTLAPTQTKKRSKTGHKRAALAPSEKKTGEPRFRFADHAIQLFGSENQKSGNFPSEHIARPTAVASGIFPPD